MLLQVRSDNGPFPLPSVRSLPLIPPSFLSFLSSNTHTHLVFTHSPSKRMATTTAGNGIAGETLAATPPRPLRRRPPGQWGRGQGEGPCSLRRRAAMIATTTWRGTAWAKDIRPSPTPRRPAACPANVLYVPASPKRTRMTTTTTHQAVTRHALPQPPPPPPQLRLHTAQRPPPCPAGRRRRAPRASRSACPHGHSSRRRETAARRARGRPPVREGPGGGAGTERRARGRPTAEVQPRPAYQR